MAAIEQPGGMRLAILLPVLDDWKAAGMLLVKLDEALSGHGANASALIVDDGSREPVPADLLSLRLAGIRSVSSLRLRRNLGHQRAIAVGLTWLSKRNDCDAVVVMDADGEDKPEDVPRLLERCRATGARKVVFAQRLRRSEGLVFRAFYLLYRILHRALTGLPVRVGNFSVLPYHLLAPLTVAPEMWSHYAASVFKLRLPNDMVPTSRGCRLEGEPKMNFVALVAHGLSALSVHNEIVGARLIVAAVVAIGLAASSLLAAFAAAVFGQGILPQWAAPAAGLAGAISVLFAMVCGLSMTLIAGRSQACVIPLRDCDLFIEGLTGPPSPPGAS